MTIATWAQAKELGYCGPGLRVWFATKDITYLDFVKNGVTVEWLRSHDDAMANKLADLAEQRSNHGR